MTYRPRLINSPHERNHAKHLTGLFVESEAEPGRLLSLGRRASEAEIDQALATISELIHTFENYTVHYDASYGARIMEAILYTYTAPFLFEIKARARSEEERNESVFYLVEVQKSV